ncbi:MAG: hypothetical protein ABIK65_08745 [Candidatus Eisenbacteria bacterium]
MACPYVRSMSTGGSDVEIYLCDPPGRHGVRPLNAFELYDRCLTDGGFETCPGYHAAVSADDEWNPFRS